MDGKQFGEEIVQTVRTYVDRTLNPLMSRLEALEKQIAAIPVPRDGRDADPEAVAGIVVSKIGADIDTLRRYVEEMDKAVSADIRSLVESEVAKFPVPVNGKDADPEAVAEIAVTKLQPVLTADFKKAVAELKTDPDLLAALHKSVQDEVAKLPAPKDGEPGKSITVEDVAPVIEAAVEKRVSAIQVKDGRDGVGMAGAMIDREGQLVITMTDGSTKALGTVVGADGKSVTLDDAMPAISAEVQKAVAAIPPAPAGQDGKSVTVEEVLPALIAKMENELDDRFSRLPVPKDGVDGKSVDPEEVNATIAEAVASAVAAAVEALPPPAPGKDGTSVTVEDVAPMIEETVAKYVAMIPVPENGKSVDPAEVEEMIEAKVFETVLKHIADLPVPENGKDGKSVTVEEVAPIVLAEVKRLVAEFPVPENGKSVTAEDVAPLIAAEVEKAVAEIPVPKDGVGLAGALIDRDNNLVVTLTDGTTKNLGTVVGRDGINGKDAELPDLSVVEEISEMPDDINKRIAKAVRLMAETPEITGSDVIFQQRNFAPVMEKTQPDIHVHMPEIKEMKVSVDAVIPPQEVVVKNELPPPRKTRTIVEEHDARGRVKKFRQEEIE